MNCVGYWPPPPSPPEQDHNSDRTTRGYVLTALTKLAGRLGEEHEESIEGLLQTYGESMNLELQVNELMVTWARARAQRARKKNACIRT